MGFKFTLEDSTVDYSSIFSGVSGPMGNMMNDAEIVLKGLKLNNSKLFSDLNIPEFCSKIESPLETIKMSKEEYASIRRVLNERKNKKKFTNALFSHLLSFTEGVAASIVATCIRK